jgi:hypothetical protein
VISHSVPLWPRGRTGGRPARASFYHSAAHDHNDINEPEVLV